MAFIFVGGEGGEIMQSYICPEIHSVRTNGPTGRDLSKLLAIYPPTYRKCHFIQIHPKERLVH